MQYSNVFIGMGLTLAFVVAYYILLDIYIEKRVRPAIIDEFLKPPSEPEPEEVRSVIEKISMSLKK